jgi:peptidoglycan/xylan/chitin deacetylase (PgdA/CDA1 family)
MSSPAHHPVILTYHSIAEGPSPLEIPPAIFAQQMEWLAANARVAPLGEIVRALKEEKPLPERTVVLTFDDGYEDFYEHAAPALRRWRFPAIVFLPTAFVGKTNTWADAYSDEKQLMSWEQVKELAQQGIEFGSHSHTHPDLTSGAENKVLEEELGSPGKEIGNQIGRAPKHFCYPYGLWNREVRDAVANVYDSACSTGAGVVEPDADPYALPRVDAHYVRSMDRFRSMFTAAFERYISMRRWIRRVRGKPEGFYSRTKLLMD